ncbi:MAG: DUF1573 domain-containing protein [Verrucomicrobia bacterium]|nr:DUF1573 domain-containing protein [Verrucomicrobiota bacterium]
MKPGLHFSALLAAAMPLLADTNAPGTNILLPANAVPPSVLAWDADATQGLKQYDAKPGEQNAFFTFWVTNVSPADVSITGVSSSCGCTVAQLPSQPWLLKPGAHGPLKVTVDLRGRYGLVMKGVTVQTTAGIKPLVVRVNVPQPTNSAAFAVPGQAGAPAAGSPPQSHAMMSADRARNLQVALGDRQAVFKDDCARCHVEPGRHKQGPELYAAVCGICHDATPRAAMVPDLRQPRTPRTVEFWRKTISEGRPGSLMPACAASEGGPLNDAQVESLVTYLDQHFPKEPDAAPRLIRDNPVEPRKTRNTRKRNQRNRRTAKKQSGERVQSPFGDAGMVAQPKIWPLLSLFQNGSSRREEALFPLKFEPPHVGCYRVFKLPLLSCVSCLSWFPLLHGYA